MAFTPRSDKVINYENNDFIICVVAVQLGNLREPHTLPIQRPFILYVRTSVAIILIISCTWSEPLVHTCEHAARRSHSTDVYVCAQ